MTNKTPPDFRFPQIKTQERIDRDDRFVFLVQACADFLIVCVILFLSLLLMYSPVWWPIIAEFMQGAST